MLKKISILVILLTMISMPVLAEEKIVTSASKPVSVSELVKKIAEYDGKTVLFRGEAIGDKMSRDGGVWINLSDGPNSAIGVWFDQKDANKISTLGGHKTTGDIMEINGVFHKACKEHVGEIDIHVVGDIKVVTAGKPTAHPISTTRLFCGLLLSFIAITLATIWRHKNRLTATE